MATSQTVPQSESDSIGVDQSRNAEYLRLSPECVRECGMGAAITLAEFFRQSGRKPNWGRIELIYRVTGFSRRATELHFEKLEAYGWIANHGRERRRTVTRSITSRCLNAANDWVMVLPTWTLTARLRESELALIAIANHRLRGMSNPINGDDGAWMSVDSSDEFRWSIKYIRDLTGLSRNAIIAAHRSLIDRNMIEESDHVPGCVVLVPMVVDDGMEPQVFGGVKSCARECQILRTEVSNLAHAYTLKTSYLNDQRPECGFQPSPSFSKSFIREERKQSDQIKGSTDDQRLLAQKKKDFRPAPRPEVAAPALSDYLSSPSQSPRLSRSRLAELDRRAERVRRSIDAYLASEAAG